jgi:hypothetical protein
MWTPTHLINRLNACVNHSLKLSLQLSLKPSLKHSLNPSVNAALHRGSQQPLTGCVNRLRNAPLSLWQRALRLFLAASALSVLTACSTATIDDYAAEQPTLDLRTYFNGPVQAYGMFQDRSGQVVKRFEVAMTGTWQGNSGVLDELFSYSDGTTERRVWRLTQHPDGRVTGFADDVVGEATGAVRGNAMQWQYILRLPVDGSVYEVSMDDWMYLLNDRIMINRTAMSKWGVHLGDVTLTFIKPAP